MRLRFQAWIFAGILPGLLLAGCAVGPDHVRPESVRPEAYREAVPLANEADWKPGAPGVVDAGAWWEAFEDPLLDGMMEELGTANQSVLAAMANLRQALAAVREARAAFFPVLGASADYSRGKTAINSRGATVAGATKSYSAALNASWELDIWGGTRRSVESSEASAQAAAADLGSVLLSMRAELATNYFQLRTFDAMLALYDETVAAYRRSLEITQNRYHSGVVTRSDVAQALSQLKAAEAARVDLDLQRRQTEHAIANLLGRAPSQFSIVPEALNARLPGIDTGLPSALLERRPDIAAAERQVAAANAAIGVAKSAYFPVFSFSTMGGYAASELGRWFAAPSQIWSLGPSLMLSLFEGGAQIARTDQAIAAWEAAVAQYRLTVLQAFTDVENALAATHLLKNEETLQKEALEAARDAEQLILSQYKTGTVNYLNVIVAQASTLENARRVAQLEGARYATAVTLIRALGGGWDASQLSADGTALPDEEPTEIKQEEPDPLAE